MPEEGRLQHSIALEKETLPTHGGRKLMETKLTRIAQIAKERPNARITSLAGLINKESLTESHHKMSGKKAAGIDKMTKDEYDMNLDVNIESLLVKMKKQAYPIKHSQSKGYIFPSLVLIKRDH